MARGAEKTPPPRTGCWGGLVFTADQLRQQRGSSTPHPPPRPAPCTTSSGGTGEPPPRIAAKRPTLTYPRVNRPPAPAPSPRPHHRSSPLHPIKPTTTPCTRTRRILFPLPRGRLPHPATARIAAKPPPLHPCHPAALRPPLYRSGSSHPGLHPPPRRSLTCTLHPAPTTPYTRLLISPRTTSSRGAPHVTFTPHHTPLPPLPTAPTLRISPSP